MTCPPGCLVCAGLACVACQRDESSLPIAENCTHTDTVARHMGMSALELESRKATKELPPVKAAVAISVDLGADAADKFADWMESAAKIARAYGGVTLIAEKPRSK